jgi:AcrR family transcriptional regulator
MKDGSVEENILSASIGCFERFGMRRATMEDIAQAAGVSRKTVYRYFATKNELIGAFVERETLRVVESARSQLILTHPSDVLVATAEFTLLREALASPHYHLFVDPDQAGPTLDLLGRHRTRVRILGRYWTPVLDELDRRKALRTDVPRPELFQWIMFVHLTLLTTSGRIGIGGEQVTIEMLRRYFGPSVVAAAGVQHPTSFSAE